jgi:hypothetical protein
LFARAVGHKPESVSKVVRTCARGLDRRAPHGVAQGFQITSHKAEPFSRARNLFSKDDWRVSLCDELSPMRPKVPVIVEALARAGEAKGLAGATSCPNRSIVGPAGEPQGIGPSADACEKVALGIAGEVAGAHVNDASLVNVSRRDCAGGDEVAEPLSGIGINLVVVGTQYLVPVCVNRIGMK